MKYVLSFCLATAQKCAKVYFKFSYLRNIEVILRHVSQLQINKQYRLNKLTIKKASEIHFMPLSPDAENSDS
jgi:hypothetical protein